jgi:hypothetical protein
MILAILAIAAILIIAGLRNTQSILGNALIQDVPGYLVPAAAILAVGAIGFVPKLAPVSRGLLVLILLVIILKDYENVIAGFQNAWQNGAADATPTPAAQQSANVGSSSGGAGGMFGALGGGSAGSGGGSLSGLGGMFGALGGGSAGISSLGGL